MNAEAASARRGFSGKQVLLFLLLAVLVTAGVTYWLIRTYVFAGDFRPVELSQKEQVQLDSKLRAIGVDPESLLPDADRGDRIDQRDLGHPAHHHSAQWSYSPAADRPGELRSR